MAGAGPEAWLFTCAPTHSFVEHLCLGCLLCARHTFWRSGLGQVLHFSEPQFPPPQRWVVILTISSCCYKIRRAHVGDVPGASKCLGKADFLPFPVFSFPSLSFPFLPSSCRTCEGVRRQCFITMLSALLGGHACPPPTSMHAHVHTFPSFPPSLLMAPRASTNVSFEPVGLSPLGPEEP